jgi:hypothetical protein
LRKHEPFCNRDHENALFRPFPGRITPYNP